MNSADEPETTEKPVFTGSHDQILNIVSDKFLYSGVVGMQAECLKGDQEIVERRRIFKPEEIGHMKALLDPASEMYLKLHYASGEHRKSVGDGGITKDTVNDAISEIADKLREISADKEEDRIGKTVAQTAVNKYLGKLVGRLYDNYSGLPTRRVVEH